MNEPVKTLIFVGVAAVLGLGGWYANSGNLPRSASAILDENRPLFPDFENPQAAARLKIAAADETTGTVHSFEVANTKGVWSIPSHEDYPADAAKQLEEAAASLIDLKKLSVASDRRADHEIYGVLDPNEKQESGATGIGKRVTMEDSNGAMLCDFIIGKPEPDAPNVRYVRLPSQDRVYRVKINVGKLSTRFEDWIEKDLLKIDTFEMRSILLDHYQAQVVLAGPLGEPALDLKKGEKVHLTYNDKDSKWSLETSKEAAAEGEESAEVAGLSEDEELATDKVNDLKNSIDQLKIVDVHRKPKSLGRDLRAARGVDGRDFDGMRSLQRCGFYPMQDDSMLGAAGEMQIGNANGVKYVLRFGGIDSRGTKNAKEKPDGQEPEGPTDEPKSDEEVNRFLLVMAEFDPAFIPKPTLKIKELPSLKELLRDKPPAAEHKEPADEQNTTEEATPAAEQPKSVDPAESDKSEDKESKKPAAPKNEDSQGLPNGGGADDQPEKSAAQAAEGEKPAQDDPGEKKDPEKKEGDNTAAEDEAKRAADEAEKKAAAEKLRDEKDDDRKIDEYKRKLKAGQKKVEELNDRFADWYYVISDAMYRKIQLNRGDLVKPKSAEKKPGVPSFDPTLDDPNEPADLEKP